MGLSRRELLQYFGIGACASAASGLLPGYANGAALSSGEGLALFTGTASNYRKILLLGDSNSSGIGQANGFYGGVMGKVARSIMNATDPGFGRNRGYAYETLMAPDQSLEKGNGWARTSVKTYLRGTGAAGNLAPMKAGDWITVAYRRFNTIKFAYAAAPSAGAKWTVALDGNVLASGVADASGSTGDIEVFADVAQISHTASVKLTCTEGTLYYQDAELVTRDKPAVPFVWCAAEGQQGFADFASEQRQQAIAPYVNARSGNALLCLMLGTNHLSGAVGKQLEPGAYVAALDNNLKTWRTALGGDLQAVVVIPPKPMQALPLGSYADYVAATLAYARDNPGVSLVRTDLSVLGSDNAASLYIQDGLHLNEQGHAAWAEVICAHFGITLQPHTPKLPV